MRCRHPAVTPAPVPAGAMRRRRMRGAPCSGPRLAMSDHDDPGRRDLIADSFENIIPENIMILPSLLLYPSWKEMATKNPKTSRQQNVTPAVSVFVLNTRNTIGFIKNLPDNVQADVQIWCDAILRKTTQGCGAPLPRSSLAGIPAGPHVRPAAPRPTTAVQARRDRLVKAAPLPAEDARCDRRNRPRRPGGRHAATGRAGRHGAWPQNAAARATAGQAALTPFRSGHRLRG